VRRRAAAYAKSVRGCRGVNGGRAGRPQVVRCLELLMAVKQGQVGLEAQQALIYGVFEVEEAGVEARLDIGNDSDDVLERV